MQAPPHLKEVGPRLRNEVGPLLRKEVEAWRLKEAGPVLRKDEGLWVLPLPEGSALGATAASCGQPACTESVSWLLWWAWRGRWCRDACLVGHGLNRQWEPVPQRCSIWCQHMSAEASQPSGAVEFAGTDRQVQRMCSDVAHSNDGLAHMQEGHHPVLVMHEGCHNIGMRSSNAHRSHCRCSRSPG